MRKDVVLVCCSAAEIGITAALRMKEHGIDCVVVDGSPFDNTPTMKISAPPILTAYDLHGEPQCGQEARRNRRKKNRK